MNEFAFIQHHVSSGSMTMDTTTLDDVAFLRINPGLEFQHRVGQDEEGAVRLFLGNETSDGDAMTSTAFVKPTALVNHIELVAGSIVVQNNYAHRCYSVYRVSHLDVPAALAPQFAKVVPRGPHINSDYLYIALRAALQIAAESQRFRSVPRIGDALRDLRDLLLYWPEETTQKVLVREYLDRQQELARTQQRLREFYQHIDHRARLAKRHARGDGRRARR